MGKVTGFMEFQRQQESYDPPAVRLKNWKEFVHDLSDEQAKLQAGRCMDCGIPFCNNGCPVNNIIPDFNDLVWQQDWRAAIDVLHATNNFPEFTGRICPAPCEAACTLGLGALPVGIKSIEHAIIDRAWEQGWVQPQPPAQSSGKTVAVVGSGPAGLAAAQQLARAGHAVTVFEKNDAVGGLLRYGIPDFKLEKHLIERRVTQMQAEGVRFETGVVVGELPTDGAGATVANWSTKQVTPQQLMQQFDAVLLAGGAEHPRDLPVPGRELDGVHFALEFLTVQNRVNGGAKIKDQIRADGKKVVVIGGGDTGSDCVGTSNRHGAASITQFEVMPRPPEEENKPLVWPYWPIKLRTSSSHDEGCERDWSVATKAFVAGTGKDKGRVKSIQACRVEWKDGRMQEVPGSEFTIEADLVLLAMGFVHPLASVLQGFGVDLDARGNAKAGTEDGHGYATNVAKVFTAGDMRRGQSLVVWAIREGRQAAREIDRFLTGSTELPR